MAYNPYSFVDGVMNGFSLHIEPPSFTKSHPVLKNIFIGFYTMLARRPTRSCNVKVLNKMLICNIIGLQLFIAKIQGTQQCSDLEVGCVEGTKNCLICQVYNARFTLCSRQPRQSR